jgi:hypothetical protein
LVLPAAPRQEEPTSKNQQAASLWTLGRHKPVIPVVTFPSPLNSYLEGIARPVFPLHRSYPGAKKAFALVLYASFPSPLSPP